MRISDWSSDVCSSDLGISSSTDRDDRVLPAVHVGHQRLHRAARDAHTARGRTAAVDVQEDRTAAVAHLASGVEVDHDRHLVLLDVVGEQLGAVPVPAGEPPPEATLGLVAIAVAVLGLLVPDPVVPTPYPSVFQVPPGLDPALATAAGQP